MIVVEMDLASALDRSRDRKLGRVEICNRGRGSKPGLFNYGVRLFSAGDKPRKVREAAIYDWPRERRTAATLIAVAFDALFSESTDIDALKPAWTERTR